MSLAAVAVGQAQASGRLGAGCRVPRLKSLTEAAARTRATHAHCRLRIRGAALKDAKVQTVARQSPGARARASSVTIWLYPVPAKGEDGAQGSAPTSPSPLEASSPRACSQGWVPTGTRSPETESEELEQWSRRESQSPGPTELVGGFLLSGGPARSPDCERAVMASPGTLEVMNATKEVVASQTSTAGQLVEIPLPAGTYTVTSTFVSATICLVKAEGGETCEHPQETYEVTIPPGYSVRRNFILDIP